MIVQNQFLLTCSCIKFKSLFLLTVLKNKAPKKPKPEKKEPESPTSKMPKIPLMDPKSVRANAKKALFQTLWKRWALNGVTF